jgi:hypothetical protein
VSFHLYRDGRARGSRPGAAGPAVSPKVSLVLPPDLLERMAAAAAERRVPLAHVVRECCRERFPEPVGGET